jgi:hypothetical protein
LKIRAEQMGVFEEEVQRRFLLHVVDHLRQHYAASVHAVSDERLEQRVRSGIARARRYGLTWESSIAAFVTLMFVIAPNFDEHPAMRKALTDRRTPPDDRIELMMMNTSDDDWSQAAANADPRAWEPGRQG